MYLHQPSVVESFFVHCELHVPADKWVAANRIESACVAWCIARKSIPPSVKAIGLILWERGWQRVRRKTGSFWSRNPVNKPIEFESAEDQISKF